MALQNLGGLLLTEQTEMKLQLYASDIQNMEPVYTSENTQQNFFVLHKFSSKTWTKNAHHKTKAKHMLQFWHINGKIHDTVNRCIKWQQTWNQEIAKWIASSSSHHVRSTPRALHIPDPAPCACGGSWEGSNTWTHSNEHQSVQCKHLSRMALVSW